MCDPATAFAVGSAAVSTAGSMMQAHQQGKAGKQQAAYQQALARNQQIAAQQMAKDARKRAKIAETQQRRQNKAAEGRQRTMLAANGVEMDSGSALDVQGDMAAMGELEALKVRDKGEREAMSFDQQASDAQQQSLFQEYQGRVAANNAKASMADSLWGGVQKIGGIAIDEYTKQ